MKAKIFIPILIIVLITSVTGVMYFFTYNRLDDIISASVQTLSISDMRITDISLFPPSADIELDCTIYNPTDRDFRLVKVSFDVLIDSVGLGTVTASDKLLPAHQYTILQGSFHIGTLALSIIQNPPYTMKLSGEIIASINVLFLTVTRSHTITETEEIF